VTASIRGDCITDGAFCGAECPHCNTEDEYCEKFEEAIDNLIHGYWWRCDACRKQLGGVYE